MRLASPIFASALVFAFVLGASSSARAQRYYEREEEHVGLYFAGGLGVSLQLLDGEHGAVSGQADVRLGYSFGRRFQIYLEGVFSGSSHNFDDANDFGTTQGTLTASDVMVGIRYFLFYNRNVGIYARAGLGLGIVGISVDGQSTTDVGIAEVGALGMEFRLPGGQWSLSPEVFYRRTNETSDDRVDTIGLGVLINFN